MLVDAPPASFSTSLQFETLAWCIKLAFASPWHTQTFIHQSVPSHIPSLHLSPLVTSLALLFPCLLSFLAFLPAFLAQSPISLCHFPPLVCFSPEDYTTYSHEYICVILPMQLRQTYLRILGGGFVKHPHP